MRRLECPDCHGEKCVRRRARGIVQTLSCVRCQARGWVFVDDYTRRDVGTLETGAAPARTVELRCDSCAGAGAHGNGRRCRYCAGTGKVSVPAALLELRYDAKARPALEDALEVAVAATGSVAVSVPALRRAGSFAELELALHALSGPERLCVLATYAEGRLEPSEASERLLRAVTRHVEETLRAYSRREAPGSPPRRIRVPRPIREWHAAAQDFTRANGRWKDAGAQGQRNAELRRLAGEGWSLAQLGRRFCLSRERVRQVLASDAAGTLPVK